MLDCVEVMNKAVSSARAGEGPQLVVANLLRLSGHGEHDDGFYVPNELRESAVGQDCLAIGEQQALEGGHATADEIATWKQEGADAVQAAVATVQQEPKPDPYQDDWNAFSTPGISGIH